MKLVEMATGTFDVFQRLGDGTGRLHRLIADPVGPAAEVGAGLR
jgi:hypothetical protein